MSRLTSPHWFAIITELIYMGISMKELSRLIDVQTSEKVLRHYRSGGQPTFVRGEALIRKWCEVTGKQPHEIPRQPWYPATRIRKTRENRA